MAENPSNGHAPDGQQTTASGSGQPLMPRVVAPEGTRSARALDGSPLQLQTNEETTAFDQALGGAATHYERDWHPDFARPANGDQDAPSGVALERAEASRAEASHADASPVRAAPAPENAGEEADDPDPFRNTALAAAGIDAMDALKGEQLFADDGAGGDPPSDATALATGGPGGRPDTPHDQELGLFEHLAELRARLLYAILGVLGVMCLTWNYSPQLQDWFSAPIKSVLTKNGITYGTLMLTGAPDAFTVFFQFSLASALILAMPWVLFQVWRFIEPALTNSERRYTLILVPFSSALFFMGAGLGYLVSPLFFSFFLQFQPPGVAAQWRYDDSILLMAKMLLIFGLAFQVPIIIIFGNKIGLISRNLLIDYWRHAVVVIFILVAILTPTWDPFTMTACALPPCLLYLLSIWLVKWL